ncbi:DNA-binding protein D-ETS-4 isoform X1 [Schistocerca cancellata]|uniref:DNA-binding protein D-ETS-4 isoform X1 n=2 Tax=Schistocerca cancellata TaxID=274614 RepID=UPI00211885CC|nr:DNA-binding protein D-ETS-4 isoform X1 [Schistocerca cancellata]
MCDLMYFDALREPMPQTVPSAGFTPPCDYSQYFAAELFDLSLLPDPCELPSPQGMSFYGGQPPQGPPQQGSGGTQPGPGGHPIKEEPIWQQHLPQQQLGPVSPSQRCPSSPVKHEEQSLDLRAVLSEHQMLLQDIKEEPVHHQHQRSPSHQETSVPLMFPEPQPGPSSAQSGLQSLPVPVATASGSRGSDDHKLLREFLRDPSFQKKYNLKPFEFAGLGSGFVSEERLDLQLGLGSTCTERMEPVLRLAIEQLRRDVGETCSQLGISPDPVGWSTTDVQKWLLWALHHNSLPVINMEYFEMDGASLVQLSETDFQQRAPHSGSILHAQLEIWKVACQDLEGVAGPSGSSGPMQMQPTLPWNNGSGAGNASSSSSSAGEPSDDEDEEEAPTPPPMGSTATGTLSPHTGGGKAPSSRTQGGSGAGSGSHIHLWQFLKELLASPQLHGSCIRWLDRSKGVFKIEDSVRVARLWGKRKNRPAMNYDKLSRSIRQYYKKGIMKKTERSQRLVYQFCHPYSL